MACRSLVQGVLLLRCRRVIRQWLRSNGHPRHSNPSRARCATPAQQHAKTVLCRWAHHTQLPGHRTRGTAQRSEGSWKDRGSIPGVVLFPAESDAPCCTSGATSYESARTTWGWSTGTAGSSRTFTAATYWSTTWCSSLIKLRTGQYHGCLPFYNTYWINTNCYDWCYIQ